MKLLLGIKAMDVAGGGAERVLATVASGLAERGHDVSVVSFDAPGGESFYPLDRRVRRICLGLGPTASTTGLKHLLQRLPALRNVMLDDSPDIAVGFMHSMFVPMAFATTATAVPFIASEHTVPEYYDGRRLEFGLFLAGCMVADRVTVMSEAVRSLYPRIVQKRMIPLPNPVAATADNSAAAGCAEASSRTILAVGSLEHHKDHATLIEAFAGVTHRFPGWKLRIVGEGSRRNSLETLIARHGLENCVELPGTRADIAPEYAGAGLLAVPSRFESFGLVTAEALAAGLPVIGFADCPGTNELITHDHNGWLAGGKTDGDRVSSFSEGLSRLLGDGNLRSRLGTAGPDSVRRFDPERVILGWENLLLQVAGYG